MTPALADMGRGHQVEAAWARWPLAASTEDRFSAYFLAINRGKKSSSRPEERQGRESLRLARDCDIVAHNFRPGVMEKLPRYEACRAVNRASSTRAPRLRDKGPARRKPGNDILAQAMSGLMSVTGEGEAPLPAGCAIADHIAAVTFALGS
jgi:crotonobetainyl-CoA:carnitine CoA-transferase CaiB-like acyl-CoA transferase